MSDELKAAAERRQAHKNGLCAGPYWVCIDGDGTYGWWTERIQEDLRLLADAYLAKPAQPPTLDARAFVRRVLHRGAAIQDSINKGAGGHTFSDSSESLTAELLPHLATRADDRRTKMDTDAGIGWIIARYIHSKLHYWGGRDKNDFRPDNLEAIRFARRIDAETMLTYHCEGIGNVEEHEWLAAALGVKLEERP